MGDNGSTYILGLSPLNIAIIGAVASVAVLIIYHFWVTRRANRHADTFLRRRQPPPIVENNNTPTTVENNNSAVTELLHSYEYSSDVGLISKTQDQTCAVCLSEFVDGEPVRVLPGCMHPFHVPCIDTWLSSHSSCPLCRTALHAAAVRSSEGSTPPS